MRKKLVTAITLILLPFIIIGGMSLYKRIYREFEMQMYPLPDEYLSAIEKYSKQYNVPIDILCGVIHTESSFDPSAISHAGAMGMMQITEETFFWLQFKSGEECAVEKLYDYETNIKFGTYFLSLLYEEFQDRDTALAAYNAGRGRVNGWLEDPQYSENGKLTNIPFEETANYVVKVNKAAEIYNRLYFADNISE